ncbi:hypothetical protein [Methylobacterium nodulans]|uniref:Uncharacterized protein n=1 Tax=Methylobacterium nodulans (strain LMG 21967 / CNCM I-2342 / ORS 2060) TaxID=460265 RepID=B8IJ76_METNO|nr:hypothetical protein [Methylobacterium nodulans]ACL56091.1 conserved hypothetical protein [Methylobacterium nodulans ORS 2060]
MPPRLITILPLLGLACLVEARGQSPTTNVLKGTCEKLVLGGRDASATCADELVNSVQGRRTAFEFKSSDGTAVSFSGTGAQQERQEEFGVDASQPVSVLILTSKGPDGAVMRDTLMTVGSCRFPPAAPGTSTVACTADTQRGRFEGTFTTKAGAPKP